MTAVHDLSETVARLRTEVDELSAENRRQAWQINALLAIVRRYEQEASSHAR